MKANLKASIPMKNNFIKWKLNTKVSDTIKIY